MNVIEKYFPGFSEPQMQQFNALKELYDNWNQKINVISRKDMDHFYEHHVLHSLAIATQFDFAPGNTIMDLGSGGGFPGIPLAICFPDVHFHLVDSINKKLKVASSIAEEIDLQNITVQHTRVEDIKDKKFDVVVSRAVAPLKNLWYWSKPLLHKRPIHKANKVTGLICLKGGDLSKEIHESGLHPRVWEIENIFQEPFFKDKKILAVN
ncbi:MAG: 16S rRNA (guanine(527)-N(7))-methyltransferase RsmG [Ginsengibacter sp.]